MKVSVTVFAGCDLYRVLLRIGIVLVGVADGVGTLLERDRPILLHDFAARPAVEDDFEAGEIAGDGQSSGFAEDDGFDERHRLAIGFAGLDGKLLGEGFIAVHGGFDEVLAGGDRNGERSGRIGGMLGAAIDGDHGSGRRFGDANLGLGGRRDGLAEDQHTGDGENDADGDDAGDQHDG